MLNTCQFKRLHHKSCKKTTDFYRDGKLFVMLQWPLTMINMQQWQPILSRLKLRGSWSVERVLLVHCCSSMGGRNALKFI